METAPTLSSAIASKIAQAIDGHSPREIVRFCGVSLLCGIAVAVIRDDDVLYHLLTWKQGLIPTVGLVYGLGFNWKKLGNKLKAAIDRYFPVVETAEDTIEDIPQTELLDWLFRQKGLKVKQATQALGVPQYRVEELTKHLKRVSVLVPGENNASVLNPEFSRQDVASILRGKSKAAELEPLFRRTDRGFTSEPSAREIADRVEAQIERAPGFSSRILPS